jgi:hypothetical protein
MASLSKHCGTRWRRQSEPRPLARRLRLTIQGLRAGNLRGDNRKSPQHLVAPARRSSTRAEFGDRLQATLTAAITVRDRYSLPNARSRRYEPRPGSGLLALWLWQDEAAEHPPYLHRAVPMVTTGSPAAIARSSSSSSDSTTPRPQKAARGEHGTEICRCCCATGPAPAAPRPAAATTSS